jgi:hypothetical protein
MTAPTCTDSMHLQSSTTSPCLPTSLKSPPAGIWSMHCSIFLLCSLLAACWMAAHGSLRPTRRCGSINCFTTVIVAVEEPKKRKGKLLISRAKLGHKLGHHRQLAERAAREDLGALKAMWACSAPEIRSYATKWGHDGMEEAMRVAFSGQH